MQSMDRPLTISPFARALSIAPCMRVSRGPLATALMAFAKRASKDAHSGSTSMKSSGSEDLWSVSHNHLLVTLPPRADADTVFI